MHNNKYFLSTSGELYHWKYIRRERMPNGKYRYWYPNGAYGNEGSKYTQYKFRGETYVGANTYGTYNGVGANKGSRLNIRKSNKLFSRTTVVKFGKDYSNTLIIKNVGKLEQFANSAKNWLAAKLNRKPTLVDARNRKKKR